MQHLVNGEWKKCTAQSGNCPYGKEGAPHLHSQEECNRFNDNVVLKYNRIKNKLKYKVKPEIQEGLKHIIVTMQDEDDQIDVGELLAELSKYHVTDTTHLSNAEIASGYWLAYQDDIYAQAGRAVLKHAQAVDDGFYVICADEVSHKRELNGQSLEEWTDEQKVNDYAKFIADYELLPKIREERKNDIFAGKDEEDFEYQIQRKRLEELFSDVDYSKRELQEYKEAFRLIQADYGRAEEAYQKKMQEVEEEQAIYDELSRLEDVYHDETGGFWSEERFQEEYNRVKSQRAKG